MKRIAALCLIFLLALPLAACGEPDTFDAYAVDYSDPALTIAYGDYTGMGDFMNHVEEYEGQIICVDGLYDEVTVPCVMEPNDNGRSHGITIDVAGYKMRDYPEPESRVRVTGILVREEYGLYVLYLTPEQFVIL